MVRITNPGQMTIITKLRHYPLITICVALYLIIAAIPFVVGSSSVSRYSIESLFWLNGYLSDVMRRPWSPITYMWLHNNLLHLVVNMLILYGFGKVFLSYFTERQLIKVFILGGLVGGMLYPLVFEAMNSLGLHPFPLPLLGSSGAVMSIAMAISCYAPHHTLMPIGRWCFSTLTLGILLIVLSFYPLLVGNTGGVITHLGGAATGVIWGIAMKQKHVRKALTESSVRRKESEEKARRSGYKALSKEERSRLWQ